MVLSDQPGVLKTVTVIEQAAYNFTFENGAQGWTTGFADLPAIRDEGIYELASGHRALPSGLEGSGIYLQGHNRSDDLFMYLKTQVGGLEPNTTYSTVITVHLATNVASGLMGIGGSPGDSVYVKAGATAVEPLVSQDDGGWLRISLDKGNQASEGEEAANLGVVGHPEVQGDEYRIKILSNESHPLEATTDADGRLWLIVGTDSGFEGLTAVYYSEISYVLTR